MPLLSDLIELGGAGLSVTELDDGAPGPAGPGVVRVGVHRGGPPPTGGLDDYDILLSVDPHAPGPWVGLAPSELELALDRLEQQVGRNPVAAAVAAQVFRMTLSLHFEQALALESLAYSMLLASAEFGAWRKANPARSRPDDGRPRVIIAQEGPAVTITLDRPAARNAFDARMRDELVEALEFALVDPDQAPVALTGDGPAFSAGGDLDEFGAAANMALAHAIRVQQSPARLVHRLGPRLTAHVHGACVGAGVEVPAAAARVVAREGAWFRLPEVAMGLIPGAGGTASIPRRIGRQRTCFMAISGRDIDLATALAWGLVDALEPAP
jgi:enoyl-CoA hydratase/carnithine racemase